MTLASDIKPPTPVSSNHFCTKCGKPAGFHFNGAYYCLEDAKYEYSTALSIAKAREQASGLPSVPDAVNKSPAAGIIVPSPANKK